MHQFNTLHCVIYYIPFCFIIIVSLGTINSITHTEPMEILNTIPKGVALWVAVVVLHEEKAREYLIITLCTRGLSKTRRIEYKKYTRYGFATWNP